MRKFAAMVVLIGGVVLVAAVRGVEPPQPENRVEFQVKVQSPWLAQLPILKELFAQAGHQAACEQKACEVKTSAPHGPCPIGVDFAFPTTDGPVFMFAHTPAGPAGVCQVCPLPGAPCAVACSEGQCQVAGWTAVKCPAESPCSPKSAACACDDCQCGECKCSPAAHVATCRRDEFWEHLIEISTEKAALEATLEAHAKLGEEREEMFSSVAELMVENAKLTAKLEFQGEREELQKQLFELATQNAQLKSEVALTEARAKLSIESTLLALEKERLQLRVAELERQVHGDEVIRTAKKPKATR